MLNFQRVRQQNFYCARYNGTRILKSYNTIVGIITQHNRLYQVKYSRTTSKQVTQFANYNCCGYINNIVDCDELHDIIKSTTGLDIDTRYNCA
jgi:hypothetical protein